MASNSCVSLLLCWEVFHNQIVTPSVTVAALGGSLPNADMATVHTVPAVFISAAQHLPSVP